MAEPTTMDNQTLLRRTLVTMAAMVGACVFVVGTLVLIASAAVGDASSSSTAMDAGGAAGPSRPNSLSPSLAPAGSMPGAPNLSTHRK